MNDIERTIAYLGPAGTYTHEATRLFAGRLGLDDPILVECSTFDEVFDCVDRGRAAYGVVGKENSLEGPVTATLDNFAFRSQAVILAEHVMDIHHCLITAQEAKLEGVTTIVSHPQGIAQCRRFINEQLPGRATMTTTSTAESARMAATDPTIASIGNALAAELYGAKVVCSSIEDHLGNQTAFALIGRPGSTFPVQPGDRVKTSLALFMREDRSGTLNMILSELAYAGINMTMIQSRPTKQQFGDYMFFIEFAQSVNDLPVQTALNCLRMKLREVKVLGSYPVI